MDRSEPEVVLKSISLDFKLRGLTHEQAANKLGFRSKQTLSNLLSSKKYLSASHAQRFNSAFKYDVNYLMYGLGALYDERTVHTWQYSTEDIVSYRTRHFDDQSSYYLDFVMNWFLRLVELQENTVGIALWHEAYKFIHAKESAQLQLRLDGVISGFNDDYKEKLARTATEAQHSIIETIEKLLDGIKKKPS